MAADGVMVAEAAMTATAATAGAGADETDLRGVFVRLV